MEGSVYRWKNLKANRYVLGDNDLIFSTTTDLSFLEQWFDQKVIKEFKMNFLSVVIDKKVIKDIDEVLRYKDFLNYKEQFYILACIMQQQYIFYHDDKLDSRFSADRDIATQSRDFKLLLEVIEDSLKSNYSEITSISFKRKNAKTITNTFVVKDVLYAITTYFKITSENLQERSEQLVNERFDFHLEKEDEYIKRNFIYITARLLSKEDEITTSSDDLRFIGRLLNIFQIPINVKIFEIHDDAISLDDVKMLRNYVIRHEELLIRLKQD